MFSDCLEQTAAANAAAAATASPVVANTDDDIEMVEDAEAGTSSKRVVVRSRILSSSSPHADLINSTSAK